jgi:hypothetical protein
MVALRFLLTGCNFAGLKSLLAWARNGCRERKFYILQEMLEAFIHPSLYLRPTEI